VKTGSFPLRGASRSISGACFSTVFRPDRRAFQSPIFPLGTANPGVPKRFERVVEEGTLQHMQFRAAQCPVLRGAVAVHTGAGTIGYCSIAPASACASGRDAMRVADDFGPTRFQVVPAPRTSDRLKTNGRHLLTAGSSRGKRRENPLKKKNHQSSRARSRPSRLEWFYPIT